MSVLQYSSCTTRPGEAGLRGGDVWRRWKWTLLNTGRSKPTWLQDKMLVRLFIFFAVVWLSRCSCERCLSVSVYPKVRNIYVFGKLSNIITCLHQFVTYSCWFMVLMSWSRSFYHQLRVYVVMKNLTTCPASLNQMRPMSGVNRYSEVFHRVLL